jgi:hypothetical protein
MGYKRVSLTSIPTLPFAADVHPSAPTGWRFGAPFVRRNCRCHIMLNNADVIVQVFIRTHAHKTLASGTLNHSSDNSTTMQNWRAVLRGWGGVKIIILNSTFPDIICKKRRFMLMKKPTAWLIC